MLKRVVVLKNFLFLVTLLGFFDFCGIFKHFLEIDYTDFSYPIHGNISQYAYNKRFHQHFDVEPINNYSYTFIYKSAHKCDYESEIGAPRLIFVIKSSIRNFERRFAIRKTWGSSVMYPDIRTVFLLGCSNDEALEHLVRKESDDFNDIVKANFMDYYYNNTIKTLLGFKWVVNYCAHVSHFMFVDDDYFVSTKNVLLYIRNPLTYGVSMKSGVVGKDIDSMKLSYLSEIEIKKNKSNSNTSSTAPQYQILFAGFQFKSSPHRHKFSKWYISLADYPYNRWPPYITAGAYIISREALFKIYYASMFVKQFRFDDIYLGIVALKAEVNMTHCDHFYYQKAVYSDPVDYQYVIASHGYGNHKELMNTWTECRNAGFA